MLFSESSFDELYRSTVENFPNCPRRQNSIDEIVVTNLEWLPFVGMKTLRVKGLAQNRSNGHEYSPQIIFKNCAFHPNRDIHGLIEIIDNMGDRYLLEKLSLEDTQILVRCPCPDFFWRMNYADYLSHDLAGRKRAKYEALYNPGSANPDNSKGLCKHLIKLMKTLNASGLVD